MHGLTKTTLGALLLSSTLAISAFAATPATPDSTGCPPGMHRAESEGSGVGSVNLAARKAESEGSGVGSVNLAARKAESEGSGVGTVRQAAAAAPCIK